MDATTLGDYLRARRELVQPGDVGIRISGVRRVPGLRREEVAMLAGISADYYLRLEQGRDRSPSFQVIEAIAQVLHLDAAGTQYLSSLARPASRRPARPRREIVSPGIQQLLDVIGLPAFVEGRTFDVLASNALGRAVSPNLIPGRNRLRDIFLDPAEQQLYVEWSRLVSSMVAGFRASVGTLGDDPAVIQLVGELSLASEKFRQLWARHDVEVREGGWARLQHPQYGELELRREKLQIAGTDGILLAVYHAAPGSETEGLLRLMGTVAVTEAAARTRDAEERVEQDQT